jgi:hypothetical protein
MYLMHIIVIQMRINNLWERWGKSGNFYCVSNHTQLTGMGFIDLNTYTNMQPLTSNSGQPANNQVQVLNMVVSPDYFGKLSCLFCGRNAHTVYA